jgi:2-haloacid dehalogenase
MTGDDSEKQAGVPAGLGYGCLVRTLVFDVNETLLDMRPLDMVFAGIFGRTAVREMWFTLLLQRAFSTTLTGPYRTFSDLARSTLYMIAAKRGVTIADAQVEQVLRTIERLPPYPDVPDALQTLHEAGFRMIVLSNSSKKTLDAQLANAGLTHYFERVFSVDAVERYKPDPAAYRFVARELACETTNLRLVSVHAWDIEGALRAGCEAAFVARPGAVLDPQSDPPGVTGADMDEVSIELLGCEGAIKA